MNISMKLSVEEEARKEEIGVVRAALAAASKKTLIERTRMSYDQIHRLLDGRNQMTFLKAAILARAANIKITVTFNP